MRLNLLYQFNEKYAPYAGVSIFSVYMNNRSMEEIYVYVLGENLSDNSVLTLERMAKEYGRKIVFLDTTRLIGKMKALDMPTYRGSYAANMRLFLDEVLEEQIDKVLYLDADTIVDADLSSLLETDMQSKTIAMALDSLGGSHKKQIGLQRGDDYYNSGVILFDLEGWRRKEYSKKIAEHVRNERNNYPAPDQDLLNLVCRNDILRLEARYNFQPPHAVFTNRQFYRIMKPGAYYDSNEIQYEEGRVSIYHCFRFIGEFPWNQDNLHPYNDIFDRYLKKSPWRAYKKEPAKPGVLIRIERILYKILPKYLFLYVFKYAHRLFLYKSNRDSLKNKINKTM